LRPLFICPLTPRPAGVMTANSDFLKASWCCQMFFLKRDSFSSPGGSHVFFLLASTEISLSRHFCLNTSDKNGSPLCVSSAQRNSVARKISLGHHWPEFMGRSESCQRLCAQLFWAPGWPCIAYEPLESLTLSWLFVWDILHLLQAPCWKERIAMPRS
jgi:hypothetical protein